jgi:hypothetical protein
MLPSGTLTDPQFDVACAWIDARDDIIYSNRLEMSRWINSGFDAEREIKVINPNFVSQILPKCDEFRRINACLNIQSDFQRDNCNVM